ncbi:MAG: translation initiation factor [Verrucomicrobia bacterium]|nr:MAG: translation initiation factor [Verrucomicrobiota bacterium]
MARSDKHRIPTGGDSSSLGQNPFGDLESSGLPAGEVKPAEPKQRRRVKGPTKRGRVDVRRETAGRGGKTVTTISGFQKISKPELGELTRELQRACASGGTFKQGTIVIQGDRCEIVMGILEQWGFRPVRTGG